MDPDLDLVLEKILAGYSAVEPSPESVNTWIARRAQPIPASRVPWFRSPIWAAVAAVLLFFLALSAIAWYRAHVRAQARARLASHERTVLVPLDPASAPPLTERDKQLIQLMQTDPAALATQKPDPIPDQDNKKVKHP